MIAKVFKVKKKNWPTQIKINMHSLGIVRRNAKRHYTRTQCSAQLAIFEYRMGTVFLRLTVAVFLNLLPRSCLMICVPIEMSLLDIDAGLG